MICKIVTIFFVISIRVRGSEFNGQQPDHAVSPQSFYREDVPLPYKYNGVHYYTTSKPAQKQKINHQPLKPFIYHPIQYAPLDFKAKEHPHQSRQIYEYKGVSEKTARKDHLEPRLNTDNLNKNHNRQNRLYVSGHNIAVAPSRSRLSGLDPYRIYEENLKKNQQQDQSIIANTRDIKNEEPVLPSANQNDEITTRASAYTIPNQNRIQDEKPIYQPLYAKAPRLHMNIARVYGIADLHHQAPLHSSDIAKPPKHTQVFFVPNVAVPKKTIMYPM